MTTLVTGASGFLGQEFLKSITKDTERDYLLVLRERSYKRLSKELAEFKHIKFAKGHLQHPDLFIDTRKLENAKSKVTEVIHLGALYDLNAKNEKLYKTNVIGTQNVLFFCDQCLHLEKIIYASTIAVAGDASGPYSEEDFDLGQNLPNSYAQTKFDAEALVRQWAVRRQGVSINILRFGVIVGNSQTGEFIKEDGPYYFFKNIGSLFAKAPYLSKLQVVPFPFNGKVVFPLVAVDEASKAIVKCQSIDEVGVKCFHVISRNAPTMKRFLEDFLENIGQSMKVVPLPSNPIVKTALRKTLGVFDMPAALLDYMYLKVNFKVENYKSLEVQADYQVYKKVFFGKVFDKYISKLRSDKQSGGKL